MTDKEIIDNLQHNKYSLAIKGLYSILPSVKQYIKTNNGTADDAQDVFQDALVILYEKINAGNFILTVPLKTYLLAVVKNCWLQQLRQRKKLPPGEVPDDIVATASNEESGFVFANAAFNLLGEKCKELLIMFYFKQKSFKEIAAALAFSDEKVAKNQKYRCMQKAKDNYLILSKTAPMNNNSILIDRYLQNEMSAEEKMVFENQLATDTALQEEMKLQQQIIKAAQRAGLKAAFTKAIHKKNISKQLLQWGTIIGVVVIAAILFFTLKNNKTAEEKNKQQETKAVEKFEINNATDTIIETKDGVVFGIPANAFSTAGKTVQLEIKTALNAYDIINNGLSTTSNDALLQTAGMFYINGFVDGKAVPLAKDISVSVPAETINPNMQLFDGVEDSSGKINWVNPKPVEKKLRTYDITTLDFYPAKYIPTVKALGKAYQNKRYTDSLYYSFSGYPNQSPPIENSIKGDTIITIVKEGNDYPSGDTGNLKKILDSLSKSKIAFDISTDFSPYQVDPSLIRAFWNKKFNNTFLATKEFEERLRYMHTLCTSFFLEIYLKNLDKPLYQVDELCAKSFNNMDGMMTADVKNKFLEFAARKDGGVIIPNGMQQKLSSYFQQKYKAYKEAAAKTWTKYQHTLDSLSTIADVKRRGQLLEDFKRENNNFREEFCANVTDAYKQIGQAHDCNDNLRPPSTQYYNTTISSTGWKNLDVYVFDATVNRKSMTYTDPASGKTATLTYSGVSFKIENAAQFDRVLVYLIPDSLSSFQRVTKEGDVFKEQLNALFKYEAIAVAYKGTQAYFFKQQNVQAKEYLLSVLPVTDDALRKSLNTYSLSKSKALKIDFEYQLFEQQEAKRLVQLQKDMEFRDRIAASIFACAGNMK